MKNMSTYATAIRRPQIAKRPFSRLDDGEVHPVTVIVAKIERGEPASTEV